MHVRGGSEGERREVNWGQKGLGTSLGIRQWAVSEDFQAELWKDSFCCREFTRHPGGRETA